MVSDPFKERIQQIHQDLDAYTYYDLLNLQPNAGPDEIRQAFHRMALSMHPDRHRASADTELKEMLYAVYKRVSEGYRVLSDDRLRSDYHACLERGELRLSTTERVVVKRAENAITSPQAKKFFRMGETSERAGDLKNARINFKFALDLEPDSAVIQQKLDALNKS